MSAIYQKARPVHWDEVVGQEHVKDVLAAALAKGRVGHAYLFSGPRGVGKTTTARLIAMTANCEGPEPKPCGVCESCRAVRAGSHPDVREIDAASNNSVEDVRELRENVNLAAMRGGKKIYILDEAHMMSRAAFNALLKTLEEPPSHVIFILATTEPEKILPTILSRCQHYRFRRHTAQEVAGKLTRICEEEGVQAEPEALALIGRLADGAMRDGESLLERMFAAGGAVTRSGVEAALGLPPTERVGDMARALVMNEAGTVMAGAGALYRDGYAARTVVEGLLTALRDALHAELGVGEDGARIEGADLPRLLRLQAALDAQESRFARGADLLSLELALTHALLAGEVSTAAGAPATAGAPAAVPGDLANRLARLEREVSGLKSAPPAAPAARAGDAVPEFNPGGRRAPEPREPAARAAPAEAVPGGNWADVVKLAGIQMRAFLKPARVDVEPGVLRLTYDERSKFHARQLLEKFDELLPLVRKVFGNLMFEVMTSEGSKRAQTGAGGSASVPVAAPRPQPEPTPPAVTPKASAPVDRAPAPEPAAPRDLPDFRPQGRSAASASVAPAPAVSEVAPPAFTPSRTTRPEPARSGPAVQEPPAAPAPTYLEPEPVTQEPDWDDLGLSFEAAAPATQAAPLEVPAVATPTPAPATPRAGSAPRRGAEVGGGVRGHPLFEEAQRRFSGKVREAGKVRAARPTEDAPVDDAGDAEANPEAS